MWSNSVEEKTMRSLPPEGISLTLLEEGSQKILSDLVKSLYTGHLNTDALKVTEQLQIADYLQVSFLS